MSIYNKNNKFISYLIILFALFVLILWTKDQIMLLQENLDLKETVNLELTEKKDKLNTLNTLKAELLKWTNNSVKYYTDIKEDELIDYIYSYIEKENNQDAISIIKNISISNSEETEIWFKETKINLNIIVDNEEKLKKLLNFLVSEKSQYKFFIESFSFPYGEVEWPINVSIPLKVLHK